MIKEAETFAADFLDVYGNNSKKFKDIESSTSDFSEVYEILKNQSTMLRTETSASDLSKLYKKVYSIHPGILKETESPDFSKIYRSSSRATKEIEASTSEFPESYSSHSSEAYSSHSRASKETDMLCQVCDDSALTRHFGAISCNACAAFFRRSIAGNRTYTCPKNFNCIIRYDIPKRLCRACRLKKCEKVGMKAEDVQSAQKPNRSRISPLIPPLPLPLIQQLINYEPPKLVSFFAPQYSGFSMNFDSYIEWHTEEAEKLANYLNFFNIGISPGTSSETLLNLWAMTRAIQSTVSSGGYLRHLLYYKNDNFIELTVEKIRELHSLSEGKIQDEFCLGFLMKVFNEIMDLAKVAASCSLTDADWALITHSSILATIFQSSSPMQVAAQFNQLRLEMELFYLKPKLDFVNGLVDILLNLRTTSENALQALKLSGKKNIWEIVFERKFVFAKG